MLCPSFPPTVPPTPAKISNVHRYTLQQKLWLLLFRCSIKEVSDSEKELLVLLVPKKEMGPSSLSRTFSPEGHIQNAHSGPDPLCSTPGQLDSVLLHEGTYFHILVLQFHRRYLWFKVCQQQFQMLHQGICKSDGGGCCLSTSFLIPRWLVAELKVGSPLLVMDHLWTMADFLTSVGLTVNEWNSHLTQLERLSFIESVLDTV